VDFDPPGIGHAHGTMLVQSNAPGSPSAVSLDGVGIKRPSAVIESHGAVSSYDAGSKQAIGS
jgi:hypothetical protein